MKNHCRNH